MFYFKSFGNDYYFCLSSVLKTKKMIFNKSKSIIVPGNVKVTPNLSQIKAVVLDPTDLCRPVHGLVHVMGSQFAREGRKC